MVKAAGVIEGLVGERGSVSQYFTGGHTFIGHETKYALVGVICEYSCIY
jgi:hypothetical protein